MLRFLWDPTKRIPAADCRRSLLVRLHGCSAPLPAPPVLSARSFPSLPCSSLPCPALLYSLPFPSLPFPSPRPKSADAVDAPLKPPPKPKARRLKPASRPKPAAQSPLPTQSPPPKARFPPNARCPKARFPPSTSPQHRPIHVATLCAPFLVYAPGACTSPQCHLAWQPHRRILIISTITLCALSSRPKWACRLAPPRA